MRIAVVVTARASWTKLEPVCRALKNRPEVDLQIIACASALLERYGKVIDVIKNQGYEVAAEVYSVIEGENLLTSAKETGSLTSGLASVLSQLRPDVAVVCADRHEVLGAAQAVAYQHLRLAHLQGGERTGSVDDRVRDAITALADLHFTATTRAEYRVYGLTGARDSIWNVGCPSIDLAKQALTEPPVTDEELGGSGPAIDFSQPFVVVLQHADTRYADDAYDEMVETLEGVKEAGYQAIVMWPGQDAGAAGISKAIRTCFSGRTVRNLPPVRFLRLLSQAACLVGNSSAGIRESSYLGVPVCNLGLRQWGRERAKNVLDGPHERAWIAEAIKAQVRHGRYAMSGLYGQGDAGEKIAEVLCGLERQRARVVGTLQTPQTRP